MVGVGAERLFHILYSKEGVTWGDPFSMLMYAISTSPLIHSVCDPRQWTQLYYVDDASAGGTLSELHDWFDLLCSHGPTFGYHPELTKSFVFVHERCRSEAVTIFDLGIQVLTGHRFLSGFLGSHNERDEYVMSKICKWVRHVYVLPGAAVTQLQFAYGVLSRSLQHE